MGVYIRLNTEGGLASPRDRVRARIEFGGRVWEAFSGWFIPSAVEIWRNASLEELGGKSIREPMPIDPKSNLSLMMETLDGVAKNISLDDLFQSVIVIKGSWKIGDRSLVGQISINNAFAWRKMYQDIDIDAETRTEDEDFADVILRSPEMGEQFVRRLIERLTDRQNELARLAAIYFFNGPVSRAEIFNAKSVYYPSKAEFVSDILTSYRTELNESDSKLMKRLHAGLSPYRPRFLVSQLMQSERFQAKLDNDLGQANLLEIPGNSVLFLGQDKDSFRKAYNLLKSDVFEKLAKGLRPAQKVRIDIENSLGYDKQTGIDDEAIRDSFENPDGPDDGS